MAHTLKSIYPDILKSSTHLVSSSILNQKIMSRNANPKSFGNDQNIPKNPEIAKKI